MKIRMIFVILTLIVSILRAHNEFFIVNDNGNGSLFWSAEYGIERQDIEDNIYPGLLRWQDSFSDHSNKVLLKINPGKEVLSWVDADDVSSCFRRAMDTWNTCVPDDGILLEYTDDADIAVEMKIVYFEDDFPGNMYDDVAIVQLACEQQNGNFTFVTSGDEWNLIPNGYSGLPRDNKTTLYFNGSSLLTTTIDGFEYSIEWVNNPEPSELYQIDIQSISLHELGHILGLSHCNRQGTVMQMGNMRPGRELTSFDIVGLTNLYLFPEVTGIEDGISITGPIAISLEQPVEYLGIFYDAQPSTSVISWDFNVWLRSNNGDYLFCQNSDGELDHPSGNFDEMSWTVTLPSNLPPGYNWHLTEDGYISAKVSLQVEDSDGIIHYTHKNVNMAIPEINSNITSNTTIGGLYKVTSDISIISNATLTVNPGAELLFESGVSITAEYGSKIVANGTAANPITFKSNGSTKWDGIELKSDGNNFNY